MDIPKILQLIRPGEEWSLSGTEYDGLVWHSATPKPTLEAIEAGAVLLAALQYKESRARAYPSIGDQLDALWKGGAAAAAMAAKVQAVKDAYPKRA